MIFVLMYNIFSSRLLIGVPDYSSESYREKQEMIGFIVIISQRGVVVVVVVFFTLTDRASTIPSNTRGCQSGTWSAEQKKIRGTSTKLQ